MPRADYWHEGGRIYSVSKSVTDFTTLHSNRLPDTPEWLLYGANGYTGELIARHAKARGMTPILAGRNRDAIDGRPRGFIGKAGVSRVRFRELAHRGELPGIHKSSW